LFAIAFAGLAPLLHEDAKERLLGEYIVVYKNHITPEFADQLILESNITTEFRYRTVLNGFSAKLSDDELQNFRSSPAVQHVEVVQLMHIWGHKQVEPKTATCSQPRSVNSWGLTRLAEVWPDPDDFYAYPQEGGSGVDAYIIDTGIYISNVDFGSRAVFGWKAQASWSNTDANGHGTHVASTCGGRNYGVAPLINNLYAVKVLGDDGSGTNAGVIAGVDWAASQYRSRGRNAVANLSLGGGISTTLDNACNSAMNLGLVMVVAAGNDDQNACNYSPARASACIGVGSTEQGPGNNPPDVRSYFSNWGTCVKIFAPGSEITAAWIGSTTAVRTISGTSMASPHVAGVAALLLSQGYQPSSIRGEITSLAHQGMITMNCGTTACNQSPNLLAWNGCNLGDTTSST